MWYTMGAKEVRTLSVHEKGLSHESNLTYAQPLILS